MKILLLGPPASGKGTIGSLLSSELNIPLINTGHLLRQVPKESIWYYPIREAMDKGLLAPDNMVAGLLKEVTSDSLYENGYLLDGWSRQLNDLKYFDPGFDIVVHLTIDKDTSWKRIKNRRICSLNGHSYDLLLKPPQKKDICDIDNSFLVKRKDDTKEIFNTRWRSHLVQTVPVIDYFKKLGNLIEVNANGNINEVFDEVINEITLRRKALV
ncbi:adenylate kinase family protein [Patescibacteria group bacterium]